MKEKSNAQLQQENKKRMRRCWGPGLGSLEYIFVKKPNFVLEFINSIVCETEKAIILRLVRLYYSKS